jgi:hypothetical protein
MNKEQQGLTEEEIKDLIATSDEFAVSCLKELYKKQTEEEKRVGVTKIYNDVGFNKNDSEMLSSMAQQAILWETQPKYPKPLSVKQYIVIRNRLPKYSRQIANLLNG